MVTIDAQVHAYERNHPGRPWAAFLQGPPEVTGDNMVAAMDAVGVEQVGGLAARNPNTMLVIDHLGLPQPFEPPAPAESFADLPKLLALAAHDNIVVKITGACTLSHEPFPYNDLWDPLWRIFDAFGFERCLWGTDWTRAVALLTYEQGVEAFRVTDRLSDSDRATLMGEALQRVYNWSPSRA